MSKIMQQESLKLYFTFLSLSIKQIENKKSGFSAGEVKDLKKPVGDLKNKLDQTKSV